MTVVFSNSKNHIWRAIQEAMGTAGFVVADVRTLDKKQGSYRQVTSSAVKQDLVISAYKPTEALAEQFKLGAAGAESVWSFVSEHLGNVPVFVAERTAAETIAEEWTRIDEEILAHRPYLGPQPSAWPFVCLAFGRRRQRPHVPVLRRRPDDLPASREG